MDIIEYRSVFVQYKVKGFFIIIFFINIYKYIFRFLNSVK